MKLLIINGPNINMLGIRETDIYGTETYNFLCKKIKKFCDENDIFTKIYQSNHEGDIIDTIQAAYGFFDAIIINAGGYTHTSVAIHDALASVKIKTIEVHISDINNREDFRKHSYISPIAEKVICGHGTEGYFEAIKYLLNSKK
ncbi:MAG: type II 3-dehydroquinate dehydratase [Clostridia bacterium]